MRIVGWKIVLGMLVLGRAASVWGEDAPAAVREPPADSVGVVAALLAAEPRELEALEAIIGSFARDPKLWEQAVGPLERKAPYGAVLHARVTLAIDLYHQDPRTDFDPSLGSYELDLLGGREASLKLLEAKLGAPVALRKEGLQTLRYGESFFVQERAASDGMTLLWYGSEPEFAIPQRGAAETARLVAGVAAVVRAGWTRAAIERQFGRLTFDQGWNWDGVSGPTWQLTFAPAGRPVPNEVVLRFKRPIPADGLMPVLRIVMPRIVTSDVHGISRYLIDYADPHFDGFLIKGYHVGVEVESEGLRDALEPYHGPGPLWIGEHLQVIGIRAAIPRQ